VTIVGTNDVDQIRVFLCKPQCEKSKESRKSNFNVH